MLQCSFHRIFSFSFRTLPISITALTSFSSKARISSTMNKNDVRNEKIGESLTFSKVSCTVEKRTCWTFDDVCTHMEYTPFPNLKIVHENNINNIESYDLVLVGVFGPDDIDNENTRNKSEPMFHDFVQQPLSDYLIESLKESMMEQYDTFQHGKKSGSVLPMVHFLNPGQKTKKYIVVGLGSQNDVPSTDFYTKLGSTLVSQLEKVNAVKCAFLLPPNCIFESNHLRDVSQGIYTQLYSDNRYRTGTNQVHVAETLELIQFISLDTLSNPQDSIQSGIDVAQGTYITKDIVNAPHNYLNPISLSHIAMDIAKDSNKVTCTILSKEDCEKLNMGAFLAVGRGAENEPKFIHLIYTPNGTVTKKVGIVGKGVCFDSGGYNIKKNMMELMKFDCGGAAAILGAAKSISTLNLQHTQVHFFVAACENMINEKAYVPGDILVASNGKTIEVMNTDAEGRLTLADALVYADKTVNCDIIVELSTLTGACIVALGNDIAGLWSSSDELAKELIRCSEEKVWRMPLQSQLNEQLNSKIADIKNLGGSGAGSTTAALFLQKFVSSKKPFAHIDIAGPVWNYKQKVASGFGVKMLTNWVIIQDEKEKKQ